MDSEDDNFEHLYEDGDDSKHDKLVEKVLSLNKTQQLRKPTRTEPTLQISEFNLVKSITGAKGSVKINDLTKVLKNKKSRVKISENVNKTQKSSHTLPKPLEKPQANKIRRSVAYEKTRLQLDRWEPVITSNRVSTNLSFPLDNDVKLDRKESENFTGMWRLKSKLEEELEKIEPKVEEYHIELEEEKFPLTMKEMLARRKEAAKLRAFQGYKEAKARRQNKIKSKKYHRIQKREKIKQALKEFEQLQKTNPELALKKLDEIEKTRAEERFSLRHKSTGKWAKNQQIRAKYDKESRQVLSQQLTLSRELTQKLKSTESSDDEDEDINPTNVKIDKNNPWVSEIRPDKDVTDFVNGYRKYWIEQNSNDQPEKDAEKVELLNATNIQQNSLTNENIEKNENKVKTIRKSKRKTNITSKKIGDGSLEEEVKTCGKREKSKKVDLNESKATSDWEVSILTDESIVIDDIFGKLEHKIQKKNLQNIKKLKRKLNVNDNKKASPKDKIAKKIDLSLPLQVKKPIIDDELIQDIEAVDENQKSNKDLAALKNLLNSDVKKTTESVDPEKYINVKATNLTTAIPDLLTIEENEEREISQRDIISEAFEDDDIVEEFSKEKKDEIDKNKPKNIDLSLPGWGSWGGHNIKVNKRKRRRFIVKAPRKMPRRDDNKGSLIINENTQSKIKEHMVSDVPFPFTTVKDFEASMRAPIGNTFVPETAFRKLIKPVVTTKLGAVIEPISKDILLNKNG